MIATLLTKHIKWFFKIREFVLILFISIIFTIYFTYPLAIKISTFYSSENNDFLLNSWTYWYTSHSILNGTFFKPEIFFNSQQLYPFPLTIAQLDFLAFPSLALYTPIFLFTQNHILSINLTILLTFILNFISAYFCLKIVSENSLAAIVGSLIFTFAPSFTNILISGHLDYINRYFIPPFFMILSNYISKPKLKTSIMLFSIYTLMWFTNVEIAIFSTIIAFFLFLVTIFLRYKNHSKTKDWLIKILKFNLVGLYFLPIIGYFFYPYLKFSKMEGFKWPLEYIATLSTKPIYFLLKFPTSKFLGQDDSIIRNLGSTPQNFNYAEFALSPGTSVLIILVFSIFLELFIFKFFKKNTKKRSIGIILSIVGLIVSILLSFGPYFANNQAIKLPYFYLNNVFPLLSAIRTPTRLRYVWIYFMSFIISSTLGKIFKNSNFLNYIFGFLIMFFIMVEYSTSFNLQGNLPKKIDYNLNNQIVLFLPIRIDRPLLDSNYLVQHTTNNFISINGHTGSEHQIVNYADLMTTLKNNVFSNYWFNILKVLNVTYVIIDKNALKNDYSADRETLNWLNLNKNNIVFEDSDWVILDIQSYFNRFVICDNKTFNDLDSTYSAYLNNGTLILKYQVFNNKNCDMAFIYQNHYVPITYNLDSSQKMQSSYLVMPAFILLNNKYNNEIVLETNIKTAPHIMNLKIINSSKSYRLNVSKEN